MVLSPPLGIAMRAPCLWLLFLLFPACAWAAPADAAGSILSMLFGLGVVLAAIYGMLLLARRVQQRSGSAQASVKIIGGAAVGARERVVLVEIADKVLVLGVSPGQIQALHTLDAADVPRGPLAPTPAAPSPFQAQLQTRLAGFLKGSRRES